MKTNRIHEANNCASQEKKERPISLEESNQYTISFEDSARQSEESYESSDNPLEVASDYSTHCSETPSFESDAKSNELIGSPSGEALEIGDSGEKPERESDEGRGLDEFGFDEYDVDELAEYHEVSEADYFAKDYAEQGLLDDYPSIRDEVNAAVDKKTAEMVLVSDLTVRSSYYTKCMFVDSYNQRDIYLNLTTCIIGEPGTGKSFAGNAVSMTDDIQNASVRKQNEALQRYKKEMSEIKRLGRKGKAPEKFLEEPSKVSCFQLGGNITGALYIEWLKGTEGEGLYYSSEIEELIKSANSHYGRTLMSMIRQDAENEPISNGNVPSGVAACEHPHNAFLTCGQPSFLRKLFRDGGDGLLSRVWFLRVTKGELHTEEEEYDFSQHKSVRDIFRDHAPRSFDVYKALHDRDKNLLIIYPPKFVRELYKFLNRLMQAHHAEYGNFLDASITRYGTLIKRIAAILMLTREHEIDWYAKQDKVEVSIDDCRLAVRMVLDRHSSLLQIAHECYADKIGVGSNYQKEIVDKLPGEFPTSTLRDITDRPGSSESANKQCCHRVINSLIKYGLIERIHKELYRKVVQ